jgi:glycosyltransferase involved in cell wall biosynthesis
MIYHLLNSFEVGGTERQSTELILRLRERGIKISVGSLNRSGLLLEKFNDEFISEYSLRRLASLKTGEKILQLSKELKNKFIKILHCHDFYTNIFGTVAGKIANIPIIINSRRDMGDFISPAKQKLQRVILKMPTHIVANSQAVQNKLVRDEKVREEKVSVIYNGFELPVFSYKSRTGKNGESFRVGMMANFNLPVKGQSYFVRAAAIVSDKFPESQFLLAGDGPLRESIENLTNGLGIKEKINFTGLIPPSQLLKKIDILVSPSLSEGLSNSIIEAMGHGVPVVATQVGGNIELIEEGKTGLLVEPANAESLAKAVIWLAEHPFDAYEIGLAGRNFIHDNFSWERTCGKYQELYEYFLQKHC